MIVPHEPPFQTDAQLPPMQLSDGFDAFRVDEIPAYTASGEGTHLYVRVEKTGMTTQQAIRAVAAAAGVGARDIGSAGQKDRNAVTSQWLSVPDRGVEPDAWELDGPLRILEWSRHGNKLRTGHLSGNRFGLRFDVEGDAEEAAEKVRAVVEQIAADGMPNYFGPQRFGHGGRNLDKACAWARGEVRLKGRDARFKTKLFASVVQSEVFNRYVTLRRQDPAPLLVGEVVRLDGSRSVFVVEDPETEAPRLASGDIVLTGPMVGPKARAADGVPAEMEAEAVAALGLSEEAWQTVARFGPGTRRDLLVTPEAVGVEVAGPSAIVVEFGLPAGSYATQLAREVTRGDWQAPLRPQRDE